jgi:hypothetical protein
MKISNQFTIIFIFLLFTVGVIHKLLIQKVKARSEYEENDGIIKITGTKF